MAKSSKMRPAPSAAAKTPQQAGSTDPGAPKTGGARSKQARVIGMLQSATGATIRAMVKTTGWQPHSVRGFLAGVVRKRLKLKLTSRKLDGERVYRIAGSEGGKSGLLHHRTRFPRQDDVLDVPPLPSEHFGRRQLQEHHPCVDVLQHVVRPSVRKPAHRACTRSARVLEFGSQIAFLQLERGAPDHCYCLTRD